MLIGHGSFDGYEYKINLPGPDSAASELATLLDRIPATRQLVVEYDQLPAAGRSNLCAANRVVIAATKTGTEKNATVFARYWVEALNDPAADSDKNEVGLGPGSFPLRGQEDRGFYESQNRLATEHAVLEDTGKGEACARRRPKMAKACWRRSSRCCASAPASAAEDPAKLPLMAERATGTADRQAQIRKAAMSAGRL